LSGNDPNTLEQYRNEANLTARINLHRRFSTSPVSWNRWVFDQVRLPEGARVLELGSGTGVLWSENQDRLPAGLELVASDSSEGMLRAAREQLDGMRGVEFRHMDAARIADRDGTFDVVIANHMLYHVPDRAAVFSEVVRVLRPSGRFYAATNGNAHMRELDELIGKPEKRAMISTTQFSLENGAEQLAPFFGSVQLVRHQNPLAVTDTSAVLAYVKSLPWDLSERQLSTIGEVVDGMIATNGAFHVTRDSGMFLCADRRLPTKRF
jgi:ubiquinone/menaquinone biosynthesis C-methylase UbiE